MMDYGVHFEHAINPETGKDVVITHGVFKQPERPFRTHRENMSIAAKAILNSESFDKNYDRLRLLFAARYSCVLRQRYEMAELWRDHAQGLRFPLLVPL